MTGVEGAAGGPRRVPLAALASREARPRLVAAEAPGGHGRPGGRSPRSSRAGQRPRRQAGLEDPRAPSWTTWPSCSSTANPGSGPAPGSSAPGRPTSRPPWTRPGRSTRRDSRRRSPLLRGRRRDAASPRASAHAGKPPRAGLRGLCGARPRAGRLAAEGLRPGRSGSARRPWAASWRWRRPTRLASAARPVLVQALGDPNAAVRLPAFEACRPWAWTRRRWRPRRWAPGTSTSASRAWSPRLGRGHGRGTPRARRGDALAQGRPGDRGGPAPDRARGDRARREPGAWRRRTSRSERPPVSWLADEYDKDETARASLRRRPPRDTRPSARPPRWRLANKKDPAAFDALVALLKASPKPGRRPAARRALVTLGDPRAAAAFLDRVEDDPGGTAPAEDLIRAVGGFGRPRGRRPPPRPLGQGPEAGPAIQQALLAISGHDQQIEDPEDESARSQVGGSSSSRDETTCSPACSTRVTAPGEKGGRRSSRRPAGRERGRSIRSWPAWSPTPTRRSAGRRSRRSAGGSASEAATPSRSGKALASQTRSPSSSRPRGWPGPGGRRG